jgi:hypothetical protein
MRQHKIEVIGLTANRASVRVLQAQRTHDGTTLSAVVMTIAETVTSWRTEMGAALMHHSSCFGIGGIWILVETAFLYVLKLPHWVSSAMAP